MKMTRKEAGRLGAAAINGDPKKKSIAAKKAAGTRKKKNPDVFREMGAKRFKNKIKESTDEKNR